MRMDDKGVWMRMGDMKTRKVPGAFAPWNAIESVELTLMPFGPEVLGAGREGVRNVMRWVLSDEDAVEHDPFAPIDLKGASEYGLSPVQAALCTSFPPQHVELIDPILAWIHKNVPDLTVKDKRT
jgi:hypothetical protein